MQTTPEWARSEEEQAAEFIPTTFVTHLLHIILITVKRNVIVTKMRKILVAQLVLYHTLYNGPRNENHNGENKKQ